MDDFTVARVVHVVAVLMWIGGVAFVTTVIMPAIRAASAPDARLADFHRIENRFSLQAKIWVLLAGTSGFWMVWRGGLWPRFSDPHYWWMIAMLGVWSLFALMLFVAEPLFLHRRMAHSPSPARDFARMEMAHRILLVASLITTIGALGGSHGLW